MSAISVIIPTFNRAEMVCRCVQSVLEQKDVSFEVIVIDDCSPDNTGKKIADNFGNDARVRFCENLPFYYDDADYAWRILRQTKGLSWILSTAVTKHQNFLSNDDCLELRELGINTTRRAYLLGRNRLRFVRRHFSPLQILSVTFVFAPLSAVYYGLVALKNNRPDIAWAYFKGTIAGILGLD